jgi:hypothetical protein
MIAKLSEEQRRALASQPGEPLTVEDPETHARYVLVDIEHYARLERILSDDVSEPDPREFYSAFFEAVRDDVDAPGMDDYDNALKASLGL